MKINCLRATVFSGAIALIEIKLTPWSPGEGKTQRSHHQSIDRR